MDWGQGDLTVQNLFDTEYYEECVRKAREWNEKGYILPDASTNPDTGVAYFKTGKREPYYKSGMPLENFHFTVPIFLSALLYAGGVY